MHVNPHGPSEAPPWDPEITLLRQVIIPARPKRAAIPTRAVKIVVAPATRFPPPKSSAITKKRFGRTLAPSDTRGRATSPIPAIIFLITILLNEVEKQFRRLFYTMSPIMSREKFLPREKFLKAGPAPLRFHLSSPRVQAARREPRASGASPRKPGPKKSPKPARASGPADAPESPRPAMSSVAHPSRV
jgi:hypothetical protein